MSAAKTPDSSGTGDREISNTGKGMPAKTPQPDRARAGREQMPHDAAVEASLSLPHERDQSTDMTAEQSDPAMKQAARDVGHGIKDTSKSTEMNRTYTKLK